MRRGGTDTLFLCLRIGTLSLADLDLTFVDCLVKPSWSCRSQTAPYFAPCGFPILS
uniref:Uncharacterized protein n=1 Tax=Zea mays TaxID=4577 RepID=B4FHV8_MAIZE|nr:unknown [Zea mays]